MNKEQQMQQVSFPELWSLLSGSTNFGQDELIEMLAVQDDDSKDFCIYHRNKAFCVPLHKIREFFNTHAKPIPPMTATQELIYLREKVKKLQGEAEAFQAGEKVARAASDETEAPEKELEEDTKTADDLGSKVVDGVETGNLKAALPQRDESIPPPDMRKKMSLKEVRADLAAELKGAKGPKKKVTDSAQPGDVKDREAIVDNLLNKK